jgi:hypothetical protein
MTVFFIKNPPKTIFYVILSYKYFFVNNLSFNSLLFKYFVV